MWEQAWITLMEQKFVVLNFSVIAVVQVIVAILMLNEMLRRRHSVIWIISCYMLKVLIMDVFFNILLSQYMEHHILIYAIYIVMKIMTAILNLVVIWFVYDADLVKCALCGMLTELFTLFAGGISLAIAGMTDSSYLSAATWRIILFVFSCLLIFFMARCLSHRFWKGEFPILDKYRIKHPKFWGAIFLLYVGIGFAQLMVEDQTRLASTYQYGIIAAVILIFGFIGLSIWIYRKYQDQIRQEHEFLNIKQNLMVLHMKAVRQQILDMENEQRIIDQQMENIQKIGSFEGTVQIEKYLKTLKNQYRKIQAGMYTDDVFVDSVLYYYADMMRRKNLELEISFAKYQRDSLDEMCAGKILMCLMETALTNDLKEGQEHKVKLYGGTVKNQVIFRLECGISERTKNKRLLPIQRWIEDHNKKALKVLKKCVKQYNGKSRVIRSRNRMELEIILTGNGKNGQDK